MALNGLGVYKGSMAKGLGFNILLDIHRLRLLRSWNCVWSIHIRCEGETNRTNQ